LQRQRGRRRNPLTLGGNGDAVFKDAAGQFANNVGRIFSTVDSARQIQLISKMKKLGISRPAIHSDMDSLGEQLQEIDMLAAKS
jgi:hypothetical protein